MPPPVLPTRIGVVGAGTMGAGIAQLACLAGMHTSLYDPFEEALAEAVERIRTRLGRGAARGRWTEADAAAAADRLHPSGDLSRLARAELVIEAAPEQLELKRELFARLSERVVAEDCVLATNTSSFTVTSIAQAARHPERVVGMHFFNPAARMRLLEVIAAEKSSSGALALARAVGEAMGKLVIEVVDGPGFLVNRCSRPFELEGLRLLQEQIAPVEDIDRIYRMEGGFRMGPFELMDFVGLDVAFHASRSFYEQSFGEPRWRPSPVLARMVQAGRLGRKTGSGYYEYSDDTAPGRPPDPIPNPPGAGHGPVTIAGTSTLALQLGEAATRAGWDVSSPAHDLRESEPTARVRIEAGDGDGRRALVAECCAAGSLSAIDPRGDAVGFHALPPLSETALVELTRTEQTSCASVSAAEQFFGSLGKHTVWVQDSPGLVLGRVVCQLINEAAFALAEAVGTVQEIDLGVVEGLNYPRGILCWADEIGLDHVLAVLDALHRELGEERYRAAPLLRRLVSAGKLGRQCGEGFLKYVEPAIEAHGRAEADVVAGVGERSR